MHRSADSCRLGYDTAEGGKCVLCSINEYKNELCGEKQSMKEEKKTLD